MEKTFMINQLIDSDIKDYEKARKLMAGQGEDYTTECLLDYNYIENRDQIFLNKV